MNGLFLAAIIAVVFAIVATVDYITTEWYYRKIEKEHEKIDEDLSTRRNAPKRVFHNIDLSKEAWEGENE